MLQMGKAMTKFIQQKEKKYIDPKKFKFLNAKCIKPEIENTSEKNP